MYLSFIGDTVLQLLEQGFIEFIKEVTSTQGAHYLPDHNAPDIEKQCRILLSNGGKELQAKGNSRVENSLPECEPTWIEVYVLPSNSMRTMKKYLKYSPFM